MRTRRDRRSWVRIGLLFALICAAASPGLGRTAAAAEVCTTVSGSTTCTFNYTGTAQTWTVPDGVTQVTLDVFGAQGGNNFASGGQGGRATATLTVTPGETLTLMVGGQAQSPFSGGSANGGFNGGGNGGAPFNSPAVYYGSGGGGASDVRSGGTGLAQRVIVAGGGGGAAIVAGPDGAAVGGGGGGLIGGIGNSANLLYAPSGGAGGNQDGTSGSGQLGTGSNGVDSTSNVFNGVGAGGGGGGFYGGAGGSPGTGGGGGSGFGPTGTVFQTGVRTGNGQILLTYTPPDSTPPATTIALSPASPDGSNGWYVQQPTLTVAAVDNDGGSGVTETRCVLNPPSIPSSFDDLPSTPCPYLGSGAVLVDGLHTVYAASIDDAGNTEDPLQSMSFKVDTALPVVTVPASIQVIAPSAAGVAVTYDPASATDTLSGASVPDCQLPSGSTFLPGLNTVTCSSTDGAGNIGTNSFTITVVRDMVQACLFAGSLSQLTLLPHGTEPSGNCGRGELIVLYQGLDYYGCVFSGSLSQVGTSAPSSCGRGAPISLAAGTDLHGCAFAGSLTRVGTSTAPCSRGTLVGFARADVR